MIPSKNLNLLSPYHYSMLMAGKKRLSGMVDIIGKMNDILSKECGPQGLLMKGRLTDDEKRKIINHIFEKVWVIESFMSDIVNEYGEFLAKNGMTRDVLNKLDNAGGFVEQVKENLFSKLVITLKEVK